MPIAQFTYKATCTDITGISPFYANYGYDPKITRHGTIIVEAQRASMLVAQLVGLHKKLAMGL